MLEMMAKLIYAEVINTLTLSNNNYAIETDAKCRFIGFVGLEDIFF